VGGNETGKVKGTAIGTVLQMYEVEVLNEFEMLLYVIDSVVCHQ